MNFLGPALGSVSPDQFVLLTDGHASVVFSGGKALKENTLAFAERQLDRFSPRCVAVGTSENPESFGLKLLMAARKRNISSIGLVDAAVNSGYRFRGKTDDPLAYAPDSLIVPDRLAKEEFIRLGFPGEKVFVVAHPGIERAKLRALELGRLDRATFRQKLFPGAAGKMVVLFVSELSEAANPSIGAISVCSTLKGRTGTSTRSKAVLEEVLDAFGFMAKQVYFALKLHPKESGDQYDSLRGEIHQVVWGEPLEAAFFSDMVVGMTSTLLLEAHAMGCRVVSVVPDPSELAHFSGYRESLFPVLWTREALRSELSAGVAGKGRSAARSVAEEGRDSEQLWPALKKVLIVSGR